MADYHSLLMRAVANLPNAGTPATRGAIYGRARKALLEQLRSLRPPLPESDIAREETALDAAIAEIEARYGSQDRPLPSASPTAAPTPPPSRKAGRSPAPKAPPRRRPLNPPPSSAPARLRRPGRAAPSTRSPSQTRRARPIRGAAARARSSRPPRSDLRRPRRDGASRPASPPQAPTAACGQASRSGADGALPPARSQLAAAMANQPSSARGPAGRSIGRSEGRQGRKFAGRGGARPGQGGPTEQEPTTGSGSGAPPVVATRPDEAGAIGRGAGSGGRVRPPRLGVQAGCGGPAPGRAGRRRRQAETLGSGSRRRSSLASSLRWREPRS